MDTDRKVEASKGVGRRWRLGLSATLVILLATVPTTGVVASAATHADERTPTMHAAAAPASHVGATALTAGDRQSTVTTTSCPPGANPPTNHPGFADVPTGHFAADDIACLASLGVLDASATKFFPSRAATRAETATYSARLWRAAGHACPTGPAPPFTDIPPDHSAADDIACLYRLGIFKGTTATQFSPDAATTRAQIAAPLARMWRAAGLTCPTGAAPPFTDIPPDHFAADDIACLYRLGIFKGTTATQFSPDAATTRAQIAALLARMWRAGLHNSASTTAGANAPTGATGTPSSGTNGRPAGTPGVPELTGFVQGNQQLGVQWARPKDEGQSSITGWQVQYGVGSEPCKADQITWQNWPHSQTAAVTTITGLSKGVSYCVRVRGVNSQGSGAWSNDPTDAVTVLGTPGAPNSPSLTAGNAQITVSWQSPSNTGGLAILAYNVQYDKDPPSYFGPVYWNPNSHANAWIYISPTTIDEDEYGDPLANGTEYKVRVRAWNNYGAGDWSAWAKATPTAS